MILLLRTMSLWWKDVFSGSPLKVWRSDHRGRGEGPLCSWRTRCRESCPVTKGSAFSGYWYPTLTIDDQRQYHRHFVIRATAPPPATLHRRVQRFAIFFLLLSIWWRSLLTICNLEPTIAQGRSFVYFFPHLLSFLRHIFCSGLLIMMIMSFVFLRYTQRPLWSSSINTIVQLQCTIVHKPTTAFFLVPSHLSHSQGSVPSRTSFSTIRQTQRHSQTQSHE